VASVDGPMRKILVDTDLDKPRAIAVDPKNGYGCFFSFKDQNTGFFYF
jgi:hypothetical protein